MRTTAKQFINRAIYIDAQKRSVKRTGLRCQRVKIGRGEDARDVMRCLRLEFGIRLTFILINSVT